MKQIEELAGLYTRPTEIAIYLGVNDINCDGNPARNAYIRGKLSQKLEVRKQMAMLARVGSPLAIEMSEKALLDMEDDE